MWSEQKLGSVNTGGGNWSTLVLALKHCHFLLIDRFQAQLLLTQTLLMPGFQFLLLPTYGHWVRSMINLTLSALRVADIAKTEG